MNNNDKIKFVIDGKDCYAEPGQSIIEAAKANGVYIPSLCHVDGVKPAGSCRVCNVKVNGRNLTACTTPVAEGMIVENDVPDLNELRKAIIEVLFVSGNHFCPSCEKSGNCELQALGYRFQMMVPRFPYEFPIKGVDASAALIYHDRNRCVMCKRCIRTITKDGKNVFAYHSRGGDHL
ncbi:MAG: 2Fe-2S iron-sulfur cluster-binding protein, partial [Bacteroidota bacterium]|nr:2Fe-2S iron-sulfur cluster-binding protein [Bacteroidota bacterium]